MICGCGRPLPMEDGSCLKCGRETHEHAELMRVGARILPIVAAYSSALEQLTASEFSDR